MADAYTYIVSISNGIPTLCNNIINIPHSMTNCCRLNIGASNILPPHCIFDSE